MDVTKVPVSPKPSFKEAFSVWLRVALYSFGGPANQISVMHRLIVEEKCWVSEPQFMHALNFCMLLPGPEAQQLATYVGWLLHKTRGGLMAGLLFILPGFICILALSILYANYSSTAGLQIGFYGIKPAVIAIMAAALARIAGKTLDNRASYVIAVLAFLGIFTLNIPFPAIIVVAGLFGFLFKERLSGKPLPNAHAIDTPMSSLPQTLAIVSLWLMIWFAPIVIVIFIYGTNSVFSQIALFFSKIAVVSFGGAYAVLSYVAQEAVSHHGWLAPGEMMDGLGLAESTPGPLIQVVQYVGYLAAHRQPGNLSPLVAGVLGSSLATWVVFAPSFLWIFAGAPYVERLRGIAALSAALRAITAAVVGVILNLSLWFALNTLFATIHETHYLVFRLYLPEWATFDWGALVIMCVCLYLAFIRREGLFTLLVTGFVMGVLIKSNTLI